MEGKVGDMQKGIVFDYDELCDLIKKETLKICDVKYEDLLTVKFNPHINNKFIAVVTYADGISHLKLKD
jgi:hypothetical protein